MASAHFDTPFGDINFHLSTGRVGISASGGADSVLILYLMVSYGLSPQIFFIDNSGSSFEALQKCVDYINEEMCTQLTITKVPRRFPEGHSTRRDIVNLATFVDVLFTGVTQNPPVSITEGILPNRPAIHTYVPGFEMPLINFDKRASMYLYKSLELEELLSLTHSCTQNEHISCGECFACKERQWAIDEVAKC